ncbi:carbonic anhydrase [Calothrix sp. PCC 7507]|uniref:carbonic anhydrase n=1 Tax=Calothrix sp. PCC 7507 TaxID=99598 RepID=UPI00031ED809|nr:carbonic anhydrase [Calothrix sp. PCC 7507]
MSRINGFVGRRHFLKLAGLVTIAATAELSYGLLSNRKQAVIADVHSANPNPISADEAIKRLLDGNQRFIQQNRQYPDQSLARLQLVAKAQYPFAAILGCADSRIPTELIFDQGIGNLFVVRVAGNVASDMAIASLEYATSVLGSPLIVVLGHRRCGAVSAAIKNEILPGKLGLITESIKPAIARVKLTTGDINENAVIANIKYQLEKLRQSSILEPLLSAGKIKIVGAIYDIDTGKVSLSY